MNGYVFWGALVSYFLIVIVRGQFESKLLWKVHKNHPELYSEIIAGTKGSWIEGQWEATPEHGRIYKRMLSAIMTGNYPDVISRRNILLLRISSFIMWLGVIIFIIAIALVVFGLATATHKST